MVTIPRMGLFTCTQLLTIRVRLVDLEHVETRDILTDGLTKALPLPVHRELCKALGINGSGLRWCLGICSVRGLARGRSSGGVLVWFGPGGRQSQVALCAVVASACLSGLLSIHSFVCPTDLPLTLCSLKVISFKSSSQPDSVIQPRMSSSVVH
jgi:hypothetical protein